MNGDHPQSDLRMMPETVRLPFETLSFFSEKGARFPQGKIRKAFRGFDDSEEWMKQLKRHRGYHFKTRSFDFQMIEQNRYRTDWFRPRGTKSGKSNRQSEGKSKIGTSTTAIGVARC